jgi:hypothetical protein
MSLLERNIRMMNILFWLIRAFLSNAATLANDMEIEAITIACGVYAFILYQLWLYSRWNATMIGSPSPTLPHHCTRHVQQGSPRIGCCEGTGQKA